jgi:hypothetical protein
MKTKKFLLLCLLLGIGMTQLSAQNGKNTHDTKSERVVVVWPGYWQPIICDGAEVDNLTGTVTVYAEYHYKDGIPIWASYHSIGEAKSEKTGEVFTVKENDFKQYTVQGEWPRFFTVHFNLKGDQGSHYIGTVTYDNFTGDMSVIKFICNGN